MAAMLDVDRNRRLGLHPDYRYRPDPLAFDDRELKDEWQDKVYKTAWDVVFSEHYRSVIDLGCGSGYKLMKYFGLIETIGYEIPPALDHLKATYPNKRWEDSSDLPAISLKSDILICSDVIEHFDDPTLLLKKIASSSVKQVFLSTPALEMLAERNMSPRLGPPANVSHVNEWTTQEFRKLVEQYLTVMDHSVVNVEQCTQLIIGSPKISHAT
jgi:SAM-dependent methyltransferase